MHELESDNFLLAKNLTKRNMSQRVLGFGVAVLTLSLPETLFSRLLNFRVDRWSPRICT